MERYQVFSQWLKEKYGQKVYKIPVNIPVTCPNRDGTLGYGGCIYCGEKGGGNENFSCDMPVKEQIKKTSALIKKKYNAHAFILFLQSFSNTYLPLKCLQEIIYSLIDTPDTVGIAISTRPDCIFEDQLTFLHNIQNTYGIDICIELGLQTANDHTLRILNRGHRLGDYVYAANLIKSFQLQCCTHVILDLPWDDIADVITTAEVISAVKSDFVKCHSLFVEKETELARLYHSGEITLTDQDTYIQRAITFLEHLHPKIVLQRVVGRAPSSDSVLTNWNSSWWKVKDNLDQQMERCNSFQGKHFGENRKRIAQKIQKECVL